jgi:methylase of polypeptide subunit release factors
LRAGSASNLLAAKTYHVTGTDLNDKALEKAKETSNGRAVCHKPTVPLFDAHSKRRV